MKRLQIISMTLVLALPWIVAGCGSSHSSSSSGGGGAASVTHQPDQYKPLDTQLVDHSNNIQVYSSPENAKRVMHRAPDKVVDEGNGVETQYYNADSSPNADRLRLRYQNGRLIGKDIIPPNVNADPTVSSTTSYSIPKSNDANYIDLREYDTRNKTAKPKLNNASATDNANAAFNNDFNAKLNSATGTTGRQY